MPANIGPYLSGETLQCLLPQADSIGRCSDLIKLFSRLIKHSKTDVVGVVVGGGGSWVFAGTLSTLDEALAPRRVSGYVRQRTFVRNRQGVAYGASGIDRLRPLEDAMKIEQLLHSVNQDQTGPAGEEGFHGWMHGPSSGNGGSEDDLPVSHRVLIAQYCDM